MSHIKWTGDDLRTKVELHEKRFHNPTTIDIETIVDAIHGIGLIKYIEKLEGTIDILLEKINASKEE